MQAGNANQRETTEYNNSQRASRKDAEPIVKDLRNPKLSALFLLFGGIAMFVIQSPHSLLSKKELPCRWDLPAIKVNTQVI